MKERITITIDKELLSWLDSRVNSKVFANRSHGFEFLIFDESKEDRSNHVGPNEKTHQQKTDPNETANDSKDSNEKIPHRQKSGSKEDDQNKKRKNNED